jgi:tetratricopeptide (TPR) repeat protein
MWSVIGLALFLQAPDCAPGADAFRRGDLLQARELVASSLRVRSTAYCEKVMGAVYAAAKEYRLAETHFAKACALDAREADACYFWSRALYSLDRFDDSLRALENAEGASQPWKIFTARGQAYDALNSPEAESELRKAIAAKKKDPRPPGEVDPLLALSALLYRQGRPAEVVALLRGATAYANLAPYQYQLGKALLSENDLSGAEEALRSAITLQPRYPEAHGLLSRLYDRLGKKDAASRHKALAKVP